MLILPKKKKIYREALSFSAAVIGTEAAAIGCSGYVISNTPKSVTKEEFDSTIMQLGFFGGSSDSNKFYSDITAADVIPKPEHFVDVPMRFISETIVGGETWKATDFRQPGVLRASVSKLANKGMYKNHDQEVDNWVGIVADPYYESAFRSGDIEVPPGISGYARIDAQTNPKIARGLLMGAIYSNSVTPVMKWEASHSFESIHEFYEKIGTFDKDGQMVRRIVLEVEDYLESSLVWLGADPFAKTKTATGDLRNIDRSAVYFSKASAPEKEVLEKEKKFFVVNSVDEKIISLSKERYDKSKKDKQPKNVNMDKFLAAFMAAFGKYLSLSFSYSEGMTLTDAQADELTSAIAKLGLAKTQEETADLQLASTVRGLALAAVKEKDPSAANVDMTQFLKDHAFVNNAALIAMQYSNTVVTELATELKVDATTLKDAVISLRKDADAGRSFVSMKRAECKRLYGLSVPEDKQDAAVLSLIDSCTSDVLDGLLKQYGSNGKIEYSAFCTVCKSSEHIEMRSSIAGEWDEDTETENEFSVDGSTQSIRRKYGSKRVFM